MAINNDANYAQSGFGVRCRKTWYEKNVGEAVQVVLQGGIKRSGYIKGVDLEDGRLILNPYIGVDYSTGQELEVLVNCDERILISAIIDERLQPGGNLENYLLSFQVKSPIISS